MVSLDKIEELVQDTEVDDTRVDNTDVDDSGQDSGQDSR